MYLNNNFNILPWYDSLAKRSSQKWYAFGQSWPLLCPKGRILPFQFVCEKIEILSTVFAVDVKTGATTDLKVTPTVLPSTQADATYYVVKMPSTQVVELPVGLYYLRFNTSLGYLYSEEISIIDDAEECVKIEYWNEDTLKFTSGEINFEDNFKFELYLRTTIGKPEYEFEEELTKRLGYKFIESQTSNKLYKFAFVAPEYICDAMRLIRLCDYIKITTKFDSYNALSFAYEPKWQEQGDLAAVDAEFDTDCIIQKLESFNRRLRESFYNALLAEIDEPVLFSTDTVAQYYTEFTSTSYINGKLIRQLESMPISELRDSLADIVLPADNQSDNRQVAKKVFLSDILSLVETISNYFKPHYSGDGQLEWIEALAHIGVRGGVTMYIDGGNLNLPSIYEGLPIDRKTLIRDADGVLMVNPDIELGGGITTWDELQGKPSWISSSKPVYSYSEIQGAPDLSNYALSSDLAKYIPISGYTDITGEKNFTGGLKVNGSPIYYDKDKKYWKLEGDLLVTGGVTMYGNDSDFVASTIMDAILYDDTTLGINANGELYVKGSVGGAITLGSLANVGSWADSVASQDRIMYQAANSSQWVAKNLSDLAVGGVKGDYLPLNMTSTPFVVNTQSSVVNFKSTSASEVGFRLYFEDSNKGGLWANNERIYLYHAPTGNSIALATNGRLIFKSGGVDYTVLHSENYNNYALPLSGGTLTGTINTQFIRPSVNAAYQCGTSSLRWDNVYSVYGNFSDSVTINGNTAWHAGNDGSGSGLDADLLDGKHYSDIINGNVASATRIQAYQHNSGENVLISGSRSDNTYPRKIYDNGWALQVSWQDSNGIVHNGNIATLNDNVASATKLATARTIWGQSFDGTGDIGNKSGSDASSIHIVDNRNDGVGGYQAIRFYYNTENQATIHYFHNNYNGFAWTSKNINIDTDHITFGDWSSPTMIVNRNTGNVGIGTTNPLAKLQVEGLVKINASSYGVGLEIVKDVNDISSINLASTSTDLWQISARYTSSENGNLKIYYYDGSTWANPLSINKSGNILVSGGITMYSARKLKNITDERGLSLEELSIIKPTRFTWKDGRDNKIHIGGIADEVMKVLPEVIYKAGEDDTLTMDYGNAAFAIAASLIKPVVSHEQRIRLLEEENKRLKEEVEQLKWNIA